MMTYLTIPLDDRTNQRLAELSRRQHVKPEEIVADAVRRRLFLDWFETTSSQFAERAQQKGFTNEDDLLNAVS